MNQKWIFKNVNYFVDEGLILKKEIQIEIGFGNWKTSFTPSKSKSKYSVVGLEISLSINRAVVKTTWASKYAQMFLVNYDAGTFMNL